MKKIFLAFMLFVFVGKVSAQIAWIDPEPTDVTKSIRLYVDLSKLDMSLEHNQLLFANPGPFYIWTWSPFEFAVGSPKVNGEGEKPWKSSNELLKMTKDDSKGANVYYYEMIPTEFYEVAAAAVYEKGINFLVKPKDGGGYGDPDIKSSDFILPVTAPRLDKGTLYAFPSVLLKDEIASIIYDNTVETKVSMQGLNQGDVLLYIKATVEDTATGITSTIEPAKFLKLQDVPKLEMKKDATGKFKITMIPSKFLAIPANRQLNEIEITIRKRAYATGADQIDQRIKIKAGCQ